MNCCLATAAVSGKRQTSVGGQTQDRIKKKVVEEYIEYQIKCAVLIRNMFSKGEQLGVKIQRKISRVDLQASEPQMLEDIENQNNKFKWAFLIHIYTYFA